MQEVTVKISRSTPKEYTLTLPGEWNDLTVENLLFFAKNWHSYLHIAGLGLPMLKAKALLFIKLCNLKPVDEKILCADLALVDENSGANILSMVDFMFTDIKLTKNLIPKVSIDTIKRYYGPADGLKDISIEEFSFAFTFYARYTASKKVSDLELLVGTLYRPKNKNFKKDGELRVPFNHKLIGNYHGHVKHLPESYKIAVYLFFHGCVENLAAIYTEVFKRGKGGQGGGSFLDSIVVMSGDKFGAFDQTRTQNLYIILKELNRIIIDNLKAAAKNGGK